MVDYQTKAPGVYIEEITPAGPIAGSGTSTAALIGTVTANVPNSQLGVPVAVTSWSNYVAAFGGFDKNLNLPFAVRGYFENGGTLAYVVPIKDMAGLPAALDALTRLTDVSLVALPGVVDPAVQATV